MAQKRIIAYFMHETEMNEALKVMTSDQQTESFVVGTVDESQIQPLTDAGLIIEDLSDAPTLSSTDGYAAIHGPRRSDLRARRLQPQRLGSTPASGDPSDASFYLLQLRGPLTENWRSELKTHGVTLLERYPNRAYKARLTPAQVQALSAATGMIQELREFDAEDTGPDVLLRAASVANTGIGMLTFDVKLHRPEDLPAVLQWLQQRQVSIAGSSKRKIRIYLLESSPLIDEIPGLREVAAFQQFIKPKLANDAARRLLGIDSNNPGPALGLDGTGQIVAVADTGLDRTHPDLANQIHGVVALGRPNDSTDPNGHGTHVAGSIVGDGSSSGGQVKGTAPAAKVFFQSVMDANGDLGGLPLDLNDLFDEAYQNGARIHNNSWGSATRSMYTINSTEVDEFVANHRDMLIVISAGNEGVGANLLNATPGFVDWLSIGSPASCKNALTVGASRSDRTAGGYAALTWGQAWPQDFPAAPIANETTSGDPEALAAFSSRGPCDDRRIKPDVVAPGTNIASTKSSLAPLANFWGPYPQNARYAFMGGTSMSAPLVAGCAALVRQYYTTMRNHQPSAALLKATLVNGVRRLTGADSTAPRAGEPNYHQGHGLVNMQRTVPNPSQPNMRLEFIDNWQKAADHFTVSGQRRRYQFTVQAGTPRVDITLAYTDLPARALQNNLNLFLQQPGGQKVMGNTGMPDTLNIPDTDNNVESIRLINPAPGNYLIQISATNLLQGPQDFALVVTGEGIGQLVAV